MLSSDEMEIVKEQAFGGYSSLLPQVCHIHPLTIGEILEMGSNVYNRRLTLLLLTEVEIAKIIKEKTGQNIPVDKIRPLDYLLKSAEQDDLFFLELKTAFSTFINEEIILLPEISAVLVGSPEQKRLITDLNFPILQEILRIQNYKEVKEPPPANESPIARKMRLLAEQRDAVKRKQQQKDGKGASFLDLLEVAEICNINYKEKTLFALYRLIQRSRAKEKWDQDIQMLCAGADSNKLKTEYWGESLKN